MTHRLISMVVAAAVCGLTAADSVPEFPRVPPTPAEKAEATFRISGGFRMELLAAEPLVVDPVALEYDADGRAWVVEMRDYPYTDKSTDKPNTERTTDQPLGRIRVLEDVDGDGRFDKSTIFAENLSWPTGLAFWRRGVFVIATPDLWYLEDTDGDLKADVRKKVFSGFRKFNVQAVVNNLKWGLDHRVYGAGSSNGGTIRNQSGQRTVLGRSDFRFDPRTERFEITSGGARFGNSFDDWGNRFLCNIRNPVQQVMIEGGDLARNPFVTVPTTVADVAESGDQLTVFRVSPPEPWRVFRARRWVAEGGHHYPRSELNGEGFFTSASGVTIYRGSAYPAAYRGNAFVAEVAGNIIHRQVLHPEGAAFRSQRGEKGCEFVASTDNWFRPVNFTNAPDGTLHVCDMYRETIEHPWSIPDDIKSKLDLESGRDRGRIYRLRPPGELEYASPPRLSNATTPALVRMLEHSDGWWRDTAHRLIFERQDAAALAPLRALIGLSQSPLARMHALWSLEGLGALSDADIELGLGDASNGVRQHAVRLSAPRLARSAALTRHVMSLADDPAPAVRLQIALALSGIEDDRIVPTLATIARRDSEDQWIRTAIVASSAPVADRLLVRLFDSGNHLEGPGFCSLVRQLAITVGGRKLSSQARDLLNCRAEAKASPALTSVVLGMDEGFRHAGTRLAEVVGEGTPARRLTDRMVADAARRALDAYAAPESLESAVELLGLGRLAGVRESLITLLSPQRPRAAQLSAVRTLASFNDPQVAPALLGAWSRSTPAVRGEMIEALLARRERILPLLEAVARGVVPLGDVPAARRELLLKSPDREVRETAARTLAAPPLSPRRDVIASYRSALTLSGDANRGVEVFRKQCAACHRLHGVGEDVGPNLSTVLNRSPEELLVPLFDPNREVAPNFFEYVVVTRDGRTTSGIIAEESATSMTLRRKDGVQVMILRSSIEEIASTGKSLMPEGLEKAITSRELADLFAFLLQR